MSVSSRTPEGEPFHCSICDRIVVVDSSEPLGDSVCPRCGLMLVRLIELLHSRLGITREDIGPSTTFIGDLGVESLEDVELVMDLEEAFDIQITGEEAERVITVADAIRLIVRKLYPDNDDPGSDTV